MQVRGESASKSLPLEASVGEVLRSSSGRQRSSSGARPGVGRGGSGGWARRWCWRAGAARGNKAPRCRPAAARSQPQQRRADDGGADPDERRALLSRGGAAIYAVAAGGGGLHRATRIVISKPKNPGASPRAAAAVRAAPSRWPLRRRRRWRFVCSSPAPREQPRRHEPRRQRRPRCSVPPVGEELRPEGPRRVAARLPYEGNEVAPGRGGEERGERGGRREVPEGRGGGGGGVGRDDHPRKDAPDGVHPGRRGARWGGAGRGRQSTGR